MRLRTSLPACLRASLPGCLCASLPVCLRAWVRAFLGACEPARPVRKLHVRMWHGPAIEPANQHPNVNGPARASCERAVSESERVAAGVPP